MGCRIVSALLEGYRDHAARRNSRETVRTQLSFLRRLESDVDLLTATEFQLDEWMHAHGWADESINTALSSVRALFAWMVRAGHRTDNPAAELRRIRVNRKPARIAGDDAIAAALANPATTDRVRLMIMLGAECGLRRAEIAKARTDDLDGDRLHVKGKGGKHRTVYVSPAAAALIQASEPGWLFPSPLGDRPIQPDAVYDCVMRAVGVNTHALRHRAGTTVYQGTGHDLRVTQEFLGHSSPIMTARYVHVNEDDLRGASRVAMLGATAGVPA